MNGIQIAPGSGMEGDNALCFVWLPAGGFDGVVQGVAKQGIHIIQRQKRKLAPVYDALHPGLLLFGQQALFCQNDVQLLIPGFWKAVVNHHGVLQFLDALFFFRIVHVPQGGNLVAQVVAFAVDNVHGGAADHVLLLLLAQQPLHHHLLPFCLPNAEDVQQNGHQQ